MLEENGWESCAQYDNTLMRQARSQGATGGAPPEKSWLPEEEKSEIAK